MQTSSSKIDEIMLRDDDENINFQQSGMKNMEKIDQHDNDGYYTFNQGKKEKPVFEIELSEEGVKSKASFDSNAIVAFSTLE